MPIELFEWYQVRNIIRIGSSGAYTPELDLRSTVLATGSIYDGAFAKQFTKQESHLAFPDNALNAHILTTAKGMGIDLYAGPIASVEALDPYLDDPTYLRRRYKQIPLDPDLARIYPTEQDLKILQNLCASEMESFGLFTVARHLKHLNVRAACLLTVSDSEFVKKKLSPEERQKNLVTMIEVALNAAASL